MWINNWLDKIYKAEGRRAVYYKRVSGVAKQNRLAKKKRVKESMKGKCR